MEAVGRLAGGVAHDFNNLLTAISGYAALLAEGLAPGTADIADLEEIRHAAERAAGLTRQLLGFARKTVLPSRVVDLQAVVQGLAPMLGRLIGEDVELVVIPGPPVGRILADPGQLEQVIMNLALNARDAMPGGGRLILETADAELDADYVAAHSDAIPGSYVVLLVTDNGCGMTPDVLEHIFELFFTTKDKSKGTGLGLSTAFGIVKQSKGHIAVYTEPGQESTFKVYLPRVDSLVEPSPPSDPFEVPDGSETILVVEDEEALRHLAGRLLERHGYTVLSAPNAPVALDVARRHTGPIDLLLTDVVMPGMRGPELAAALEAVRPGVPVVFTSGYTEEAVSRLGRSIR